MGLRPTKGDGDAAVGTLFGASCFRGVKPLDNFATPEYI
jgi:hypothetical protein